MKIVYGPEWPTARTPEEHLEHTLQLVRSANADDENPVKYNRVLTILVHETEDAYTLSWANFNMLSTDTIAACAVVSAECAQSLSDTLGRASP